LPSGIFSFSPLPVPWSGHPKIKNQKSKGKRQKAKMKTLSFQRALVPYSSFLPFAFCLLIFDF
jgi:hypothetical protein